MDDLGSIWTRSQPIAGCRTLISTFSQQSFSKKAAAWVKDKTWHPSQEIHLLKDGRLKMILKVADNEELVGWILSFGGEVRVVRPETLRAKLRDEARRIVGSSDKVNC